MAVPVVIVGLREEIGSVVIQGLKPEWDGIMFCTSIEAVTTEVPYALRGEKPPQQSSYIGSGNFSKPPAAVVFGGAWTQDDVSTAQKGLGGDQSPTMLMMEHGREGEPPLGPGYAEYVVGRLRESLAQLGRGETVGGPMKGVSWF